MNALSAPANSSEAQLLEAAAAELRTLLPEDWTLQWEVAPDPAGAPRDRPDAILGVSDNRGWARVVVEAKRELTPRGVADVLGGRLPLIRQLDQRAEALVVAPWISARAQAMLVEAGVNFLDLTGNINIRLRNPGLVIRTVGAGRNPEPTQRERLTLKGPRAGRLIRLLVDAKPPYTVSDLAKRSGVSIAYVSRLLGVLAEDSLIERERGRATVIDRDWEGLLRRRAEYYSVFKTNTGAGFISPEGPQQALVDLRNSRDADTYSVVTGSFAASAIAPAVAAPAQLTLYTTSMATAVAQLGLLQAARGADVLVLEPYDPAHRERPVTIDGIRYAAPSQVVLDCLTGNGRMPDEGEAVLEWMRGDDSWQADIKTLPIRGENTWNWDEEE